MGSMIVLQIPRREGHVSFKALQSSVADPVPFLPLDPGSGIGFFRIPDPTIISESLKPMSSWVKKFK
jgi:hypothetical protein